MEGRSHVQARGAVPRAGAWALRGNCLVGEAALHATRCLRSALHGHAALQAGGGFGLALPVDERSERLPEVLYAGLGAACRSRDAARATGSAAAWRRYGWSAGARSQLEELVAGACTGGPPGAPAAHSQRK